LGFALARIDDTACTSGKGAREERAARLQSCKGGFRSNGQWRFGSFIGDMPMTCLNERIVGAVLLTLSGHAFADGLLIDSSEVMMVANIAPLPVGLGSPIPEPQRYLHRYEMEIQSNQGTPFDTQIKNFYSVEMSHDFRFDAGKAAPMPELAPQQASYFSGSGQSAGPRLSIVQLPNTVLTLGAQPQRRLSLTVNDWVFSATARVAILHSHDTGATLSVRHGF
jgi:hypothetical protein